MQEEIKFLIDMSVATARDEADRALIEKHRKESVSHIGEGHKEITVPTYGRNHPCLDEWQYTALERARLTLKAVLDSCDGKNAPEVDLDALCEIETALECVLATPDKDCGGC